MKIGRLLTELPMRYRWLRWAVLAFGTTLSLGGTYLYKLEVEQTARVRFHSTAADLAGEIDLRVRAYADVLFALRGLFDASARVTRVDFHRFAEAFSLGERYPGLTNISFALFISSAQRQDFERAVRAETSPLAQGLPEFSIKPPDERPQYLVLHYVEPMGKNIAAWGLDLLADPLRRSVVERARDTGAVTSLSGVTLLRDGKSAITSTLLRLAVYRGGGVPDSVSERRRLVSGVVGSTLRIAELVQATLKEEALERVRVRIFTGAPPGATGTTTAAANQLLYDSRPSTEWAPPGDTLTYAVNQQLSVGDGEWRIVLTPLADPVGALDKVMVAGAMAASLALVVLMFSLLSSLSTAQSRGRDLARRNRDAALMTSLGEDLHSCHTTKDAYEVVSRQMPRLFPGSSGVLYETDSSRTQLKSAARWGSPLGAAQEFGTDDCQAIRIGHLHRVKSAAKALDCGHFTGNPPDSYICIPLATQDDLIGMLHVQTSPGALQPGVSSSLDCNLINASAQHLALAMANLELRGRLLERATRDNLTKLYNRHYMREWLEQQLHSAARHGRTIGVILLDIDHFKRINDSFGHEAGDMVLREFADAVRRVARGSDVPCRHGGEEFLLLMPEASLEATLGKAEELRHTIAHFALAYEGLSLGHVTVSAGVAMFPQHATTVDTLLRRADEALYAAKESGRNRVVASSARAHNMGSHAKGNT